MYHEGQAVLGCPTNLTSEGIQLFCAKGIVPIEIQAYLADCHVRATVLVKHPFHCIELPMESPVHIGGMQSHHGRHVAIIPSAQVEHGGNGREINIGKQDVLYPCRSSPVDYQVYVFREFPSIYVAMCVYHFPYSPLCLINNTRLRTPCLTIACQAAAMRIPPANACVPRAS